MAAVDDVVDRFVRLIYAQRRDGGRSGTAIRAEDVRALELILGGAIRGELRDQR